VTQPLNSPHAFLYFNVNAPQFQYRFFLLSDLYLKTNWNWFDFSKLTLLSPIAERTTTAVRMQILLFIAVSSHRKNSFVGNLHTRFKYFFSRIDRQRVRGDEQEEDKKH
jgi:hypothetical protein